jgi:hypothetical protein
MMLRFMSEVLSVLFQRKISFHYAMKVHCFAGYREGAMTKSSADARSRIFLVKARAVSNAYKI